VASIAGPLVGGYITDQLSWRWVFFLNLPFGIVAAALVGASLVEPERHAHPRIDYRGALLLMAAVTALLVALGQTGVSDAVLSGWQVGILYGVAALLAVLLVRVETRSPEPVVPFDLLKEPLVAATTLAGFLVGIAMFGALSFVPLFVQGALGGTATEAGQALSPLLLGWVAMSVVTGRVLPSVGFRRMIVGGLILVSIGFGGLLWVTHDTPRTVMTVALGLMGLGMGMTMLSLLLALQQAVPRTLLGVATSMGQFTRSVGGAVGVAMMGAIVASSLPPGREGEPLLMEAALHRAFIAGAVVAVLALLAGLRVPAGFARPAATGSGRPNPREGSAPVSGADSSV
jgi:MFS family permease